MSLTQEKNYAQGSGFDPQIVVSFFNEISIEKRNYARDAPDMKASGLCFIF